MEDKFTYIQLHNELKLDPQFEQLTGIFMYFDILKILFAFFFVLLFIIVFALIFRSKSSLTKLNKRLLTITLIVVSLSGIRYGMFLYEDSKENDLYTQSDINYQNIGLIINYNLNVLNEEDNTEALEYLLELTKPSTLVKDGLSKKYEYFKYEDEEEHYKSVAKKLNDNDINFKHFSPLAEYYEEHEVQEVDNNVIEIDEELEEVNELDEVDESMEIDGQNGSNRSW